MSTQEPVWTAEDDADPLAQTGVNPDDLLRVRWGQAWRDRLLDQGWLDNRRVSMGRGRIARTEVNAVEFSPGRITRIWNAPGSHEAVWVEIPVLTDEQWARVLDVAESRSGHAAAIFDRSIDRSFVADARHRGIELLPPVPALASQCGCTEKDAFCSHAVGLMHAAFHEINVDPFLLTAIQGRTEEQLTAALRQRLLGDTQTEESLQPQTLPATEAWTRTPADLPVPPRAMPSPGHAERWETDTDDLAVEPGVLHELAADAITRSWLMTRGDAASALRLAEDADIARRAVGLLGTTRIMELAREMDEPAQRVVGLATAWDAAGPGGLAMLAEEPWHPEPFIMTEAAEAIEVSGRRASSIETADNTLTVAGKAQYRFGRDQLWYRLDKRANHWMLMTAPAVDIQDVLIPLNKR